jgi:FkbM family methyltransferase
MKGLLRKVKRIPQFFTDEDFRRNVMRRRVLYPLLIKLVARFFPNIKYFKVWDGENWFTAAMHDRGTAWSLLVSGHLDHDFFETSLQLAEKEGILQKEAPNIFVDAGANIGTHSVYALRSGYFDKVIAIEPHPENFHLLQQNIADNNLQEKVVLHHAAIGAENSEATLELSANHSGDHRVRLAQSDVNAAFCSKGEAHRETISVPLRTLDEFLKKEKIAKDACIFVSMDVQGFEAEILQGAQGLIDKGAIFCMEFWPYGLRYNQATAQLDALLKENFEYFYDVRDGEDGAKIKSENIQKSYERYGMNGFTDFLLVQGNKLRSKKKTA